VYRRQGDGVGKAHPHPELFGKCGTLLDRVQQRQFGQHTNESGTVKAGTREGSRHGRDQFNVNDFLGGKNPNAWFGCRLETRGMSTIIVA
jgi:hypothetical protein